MKKLELTKEGRALAVSRIRDYFEDELDQDISPIQAEFLLQFFAEQIGGFFYNQGLGDAQGVFARKLDDINDEIYALEQREALLR